jgi:hypothetical protein
LTPSRGRGVEALEQDADMYKTFRKATSRSMERLRSEDSKPRSSSSGAVVIKFMENDHGEVCEIT